MSDRIRLAIQKKGRLTESCRRIFTTSGLSFDDGERQLIYSIPEMPIDLLFVRDDDIPALVSQGVCDFGIVGLNVFAETKYGEAENFNAEIFTKLGISKCRLSVAVPKDTRFNSISDLNNLKIATTYPKIVQNFLKERGLSAKIICLNGSVEIAPSLNLSDVIIDIVSSGATLRQNNLTEVLPILNSEAVLINNRQISADKKQIAGELVSRINQAIRTERSVN